LTRKKALGSQEVSASGSFVGSDDIVLCGTHSIHRLGIRTELVDTVGKTVCLTTGQGGDFSASCLFVLIPYSFDFPSRLSLLSHWLVFW
jgi:hypothetical protein